MNNGLSHNEAVARESTLRYILWPGKYSITAEFIVGCLALILFNITNLSNQWLGRSVGVNDPFAGWSSILSHLLDKLQGYYIVQQAVIFLLWALIGALMYILIFRTLQVSFRTKQTVQAGVDAFKEGQRPGLTRWFTSLHDFFLRLVITIVGFVLIACSSLICFSLASHELKQSLDNSFPANTLTIIICLLMSLVTIRLLVVGLCLTSRHFRQWYIG